MAISGNNSVEVETDVDRRLRRLCGVAEFFGQRIGDLRMQLGQLRAATERRNYVRICDLPEDEEDGC